MNFEFFNPTKIVFGSGKLNSLHEQALPGKKACVLISNGKSTRRNGYLDRTVNELKLAGAEYVVFDRFSENPLKTDCEAGGRFARENGCDFVVALGGGAVLDSSKMVSSMATNDGDLWDYAKGKPFAYKGLPIVAITTTSGTGSEVNCYGVISNPDTQEKIGFGDPRNIPVLAIVDPELMTTVPPQYTAYQGFDALFHNTEVVMGSTVNIVSEAIALSAIANIAEYLPRAVKDGKDIEAREHIAYASTMGGIVMNISSTTAQHSLEHSMSAYHRNLPHGAGLIMISVEFAKFFIDRHACDERFVKMARAMGMPDATKAQDFIKALVKLQRECGVAEFKMSDYGISKSEAATIAKGARVMQGGLYAANPCEMTDADCAGVIERSFK